MSEIEQSGNFAVTRVDPAGSPEHLVTLPTVEAALRDRDVRIARTPRGHATYMVSDVDDPELGYAEWADCEQHGTFDGADAACNLCPTEQDLHDEAMHRGDDRRGSDPRGAVHGRRARR
jgi:hypothetical protein